MKTGFIGAGNMAFSFIKGILSNGAAAEEEIFIYDKNMARQNEVCMRLNVSAFVSAAEVAENSEIVFLAVKPHQLGEVLEAIAPIVKQRAPLVASIAAGKRLDYIMSFLDEDARVVRVMPNVNAEFGMGMSAFCGNKNVTEYDKLEFEKYLLAIGRKVELDEELFDAFTSIACCAPAFAYLFVDALANCGVKLGMSKKTSLEIAAQTLFGSAAAVLTSGTHPHELVDRVCSPGGATIAGVHELLRGGFENVVINAAEVSYNRAKTL